MRAVCFHGRVGGFGLDFCPLVTPFKSFCVYIPLSSLFVYIRNYTLIDAHFFPRKRDASSYTYPRFHCLYVYMYPFFYAVALKAHRVAMGHSASKVPSAFSHLKLQEAFRGQRGRGQGSSGLQGGLGLREDTATVTKYSSTPAQGCARCVQSDVLQSSKN